MQQDLDPIEKTLKALAVYLERGHMALGLFEQWLAKEWVSATEEDFLAALARRDIAFHNFCALEHKAALLGYEIGKDPQAVQLWTKLVEVNASLKASIAQMQAAKASELSQLQQVRRGLSGYHSGQSTPIKLVKFV